MAQWGAILLMPAPGWKLTCQAKKRLKMYYIERDEAGRIIQVELVPFHAMTEQSEVSTAEIDEWMRQREIREASLLQLRQSDLEMVRVLEDLIEVLMSKGVISITDLPPVAQAKLTSRAQARRSLSGLEGLISDDDDEDLYNSSFLLT
jgi:hypothetical protein